MLSQAATGAGASGGARRARVRDQPGAGRGARPQNAAMSRTSGADFGTSPLPWRESYRSA